MSSDSCDSPEAGTTAVQSTRVGSSVGLHARPAALLVKAAKKWPCEVSIGRPGAVLVDAKSILSVLTLGVGHDEEVVISATGVDAEEAVAELAALVSENLDDTPPI